jgi:hypothetical protein
MTHLRQARACSTCLNTPAWQWCLGEQTRSTIAYNTCLNRPAWQWSLGKYTRSTIAHTLLVQASKKETPRSLYLMAARLVKADVVTFEALEPYLTPSFQDTTNSFKAYLDETMQAASKVG